MIILILVGLIVLIVGKLKLTRSLKLTGKRARWYGLTLLLSAIPFAILLSLIIPDFLLASPIWSRVINYTAVIGYLILLALPFRETPQISSNASSSDTVA